MPTQFASTIKYRTSKRKTKVFNRACKANAKEKWCFPVPSMSPGGTEGTLIALVYFLGDNNTEEKLHHKIIIVVPVRLLKSDISLKKQKAFVLSKTRTLFVSKFIF